jgi:hypothetical protein
VTDAPIDEIVSQTIRHARRLASRGDYDWRTQRAALLKILADLEARAPDEPSLARLRAFIDSRERVWRWKRH